MVTTAVSQHFSCGNQRMCTQLQPTLTPLASGSELGGVGMLEVFKFLLHTCTVCLLDLFLVTVQYN